MKLPPVGSFGLIPASLFLGLGLGFGFKVRLRVGVRVRVRVRVGEVSCRGSIGTGKQ